MPDTPPTTHESCAADMQKKVDEMCLYMVHPFARDGIEKFITWALAEASKGKKRAAELAALWTEARKML